MHYCRLKQINQRSDGATEAFQSLKNTSQKGHWLLVFVDSNADSVLSVVGYPSGTCGGGKVFPC